MVEDMSQSVRPVKLRQGYGYGAQFINGQMGEARFWPQPCVYGYPVALSDPERGETGCQARGISVQFCEAPTFHIVIRIFKNHASAVWVQICVLADRIRRHVGVLRNDDFVRRRPIRFAEVQAG